MFGFILSRHVKSKETNFLWIHTVQNIRKHYPNHPIVIIDDNSDYSFVTKVIVQNCLIVQSEYPGRGELLPYYYFYKYKWFPKAVIIHDSVFLHTPLKAFDLLENVPLWHFEEFLYESFESEQTMLGMLTNNEELLSVHREKKFVGMFGVMSVVTLNFVNMLQEKYNFTVLLDFITDREKRKCLERIMGVLFTVEKKHNVPSIFGTIHKYCRWGISFQEYRRTKVQRPVTKVWSGR